LDAKQAGDQEGLVRELTPEAAVGAALLHLAEPPVGGGSGCFR
jgi:hypothetical protein